MLAVQHYLNIAYQPIVSLETGMISHYETLARPLPHVLNGLSIEEWVSQLEESGRVHILDLCGLERAFQMASKGQTPHGLPIGVNLSPSLVADSDFVDRLCRSIAQLESRHLVQFELTEREFSDHNVVFRHVERIIDAGAKVSIDDVGAGRHCSVEIMKQLPRCAAKIDGSVILSGLDGDLESLDLIDRVVDAARENRVSVIAERLEGPKDIEWARRRGIGYGQGYGIGKPSIIPESPRDVSSRIPRDPGMEYTG